MALNGLFGHNLYTKKGSNYTPFFKVSPDELFNIRLLCEPGETRTHDQWLKRPLLYQLSYRVETEINLQKIKKLFYIIF